MIQRQALHDTMRLESAQNKSFASSVTLSLERNDCLVPILLVLWLIEV